MPEGNQSQGGTGETETTTTTTTETAPKGGQGNGDGFKAPASQEEFDRMVSDRLKREQGKRQDEIDKLTQQIKDLQGKGQDGADTPDDDKKSPIEKDLERLQQQFEDLERSRKAEADAEKRASTVAAEKMEPEWANLVAGKDADEFATNLKRVKDLIKAKKAPDTNTGNHVVKGPRGQQPTDVPEFKFRARGKQVQVT